MFISIQFEPCEWVKARKGKVNIIENDYLEMQGSNI